jgi:hypothetical protein
MLDWSVVFGRLVPYWFTVAISFWILAFMYLVVFDVGYEAYADDFAMVVRGLYVVGFSCCRSLLTIVLLRFSPELRA